MTPPDTFSELAQYYDPIMSHVNYDRWFHTCLALSELLPAPFQHVDVGCGTGVLVQMLRYAGWRSTGLDLSHAMVKTAHASRGVPVGVADLRQLPLNQGAHLVTCLFDSINFLLEQREVVRAIHELAGALRPGGLLYFDMVTERMVMQHFAGQTWDEDNGGFSSTWASHYDEHTSCTETSIRINAGSSSMIRERIYPQDFFELELEAAGLTVLGVFDAERWRPPTQRTTRVDFIAMKEAPLNIRKEFKQVVKAVRRVL